MLRIRCILQKHWLRTYHIKNCFWFLYSESFDHLKHINHSLRLASFNGGHYGTKHTTTTHSVTGELYNNIHKKNHKFIFIEQHYIKKKCSLAVNNYRVVSCSPLNYRYILNHINDRLQVGALTISIPVRDVELSHLLRWFL